MTTHTETLKQAMSAIGLVAPDHFHEDGKFNRIATTEKPRSRNGWYVFAKADPAMVIFGDWATGHHAQWCSQDTREFTIERKGEYKLAIKAAIKLADAERKLEHDTAAKQAAAIWGKAKPATDHRYLTAKGIQAHGTRVISAMQAREVCPALSTSLTGPLLVIPMRDGSELRSLQFITEDGVKRPLTGGQKQGCYFAIGGSIKTRVIVAEGFATAASIHQATGEATAVAFDRTNLKAVAMKLKERFKSAEIVMGSDDDHQTAGNPGKTDATAAALAVEGRVVMPAFKGTLPPGADFNDLHQAEGLDAVKACFDAVPIDEDIDHHRNAPKPDPACLYGLVGDIAKAGSDNTEANPYAVAMSALAYLGTAIGRGPHVCIGDDWHHGNGFFLHVGRSARGRKGTAKKLIQRIAKRIKEASEYHAPQIHRGGLSSREGLAFMIHDGYRDGKDEVPAINDKRLMIIESEFANVLHQSKRDGNTLSSALRDSWDGTSIKPAIKGQKMWASNPHITLMGDVTPSELLALMNGRELSNGFANRFLMIWAEGGVKNAFPQFTHTSTVNDLAERIIDVLSFTGADRHAERDTMRMTFSPEASKRYATLYYGELNDRSSGERIAGLLDRRAPVLIRLAMIFALTDKSTVIEVHHLNAAMAWVRYWVDSVKFIFQTAMDEVSTAQVSDVASKIITYLTDKGQATRWELTSDCFKNHTSKSQIDQALDDLLTGTPPQVTVDTVPRPKGTPGTPTKIYKLAAKCAKSAKSGAGIGFAGDSDSLRSVRSVLSELTEDFGEGDTSQHFAHFASNQNGLETRMDIDTSQTSHTSHGIIEIDEIEVQL